MAITPFFILDIPFQHSITIIYFVYMVIFGNNFFYFIFNFNGIFFEKEEGCKLYIIFVNNITRLGIFGGNKVLSFRIIRSHYFIYNIN